METVPSPILHNLTFSNNIPTTRIHNRRQFPKTHLDFHTSFRGKTSSSFLGGKTSTISFKNWRPNASVSDSYSNNASRELAVLLEAEGVLMDLYSYDTREAFNVAFKKMGLDCAFWTEPIYLDLSRKTAGSEEDMLNLYFNKIGWPTALPTSEKGTFLKSLLREKKKSLDDLMMSKSSPLRPGVEDLIDDAAKEGVPVVVLTAYCKNEEKLAQSVTERLANRMSKIKIVGHTEMMQSFYGQLVFGEGVSSSFEVKLAKEARKAVSSEKQRIAKEVASLLNVSVDIDTSSDESLQKIVATLRAGAELAQVDVSDCVLIAGSQPGVVAASQIGMPCVVLRSKSTSRVEFPLAKAVMDSFGGADLTISRLRNIKSS